jgi:hypothetical protein
MSVKPGIPALRKLRLEDLKFTARLCYIATDPVFSNNKKERFVP